MTDYVSSFLDNIKQKTTNPFLGTIIFVAIVRYWDLVYAFFMFDDDCDMLYKQTYIHNYFAIRSFWKEIGLIVFQSFLILIATYILLALSRLLLKFYEKHLISRADKFTDKNSVKTLVEYQALEKRLAETFEQLRKVNNDNNELEIRIGAYKEEVYNRETKISELNIANGEANQKNIELTSELESFRTNNGLLVLQNSTLESKIKENDVELSNLRDKINNSDFFTVKEISFINVEKALNSLRFKRTKKEISNYVEILSDLNDSNLLLKFKLFSNDLKVNRVSINLTISELSFFETKGLVVFDEQKTLKEIYMTNKGVLISEILEELRPDFKNPNFATIEKL